jgi:hypothetical protein
MVPNQVANSALASPPRPTTPLVNQYEIFQCCILNVNIVTRSLPAARNARAPSVIQLQEGLPLLAAARVRLTRVAPPMGGTVIKWRLTQGSSARKEVMVDGDFRGSTKINGSRYLFRRNTWADGGGRVMPYISAGPLIRNLCNL